jgi:hypothetical protein
MVVDVEHWQRADKARALWRKWTLLRSTLVGLAPAKNGLR